MIPRRDPLLGALRPIRPTDVVERRTSPVPETAPLAIEEPPVSDDERVREMPEVVPLATIAQPMLGGEIRIVLLGKPGKAPRLSFGFAKPADANECRNFYQFRDRDLAKLEHAIAAFREALFPKECG